jgi:hypothetical protein
MASFLVLATPARAAFHFSEISEVMSGTTADATLQFVEIRMKIPLQSFVAHSRLTAFDCTGTTNTILLEVPSDLAAQGTDVRWIMAGPSPSAFSAAFGVMPDFTFTGSIDPTCGNLCWGAPAGPAFLPPNPPTWDASQPSNYVDCIAYGGYTGPLKAGQPVVAGPLGDGMHSLTRTIGTTTFALQCPTPENDAGTSGALAGCATTPTTTTTTPGSTATTTTVPSGAGTCPGATDVRAAIESKCPCSSETSHRAYVHCAAGVIASAVKAGTLSKSCKHTVKKCVGASTCGRAGAVACCRTTAKGVHRCAVVKSAAACKAPKGGTACPATTPSCCEACASGSCASATTPSATVPSTTRHHPPTTMMGY